MTLERVVRPFQQVDVFRARRGGPTQAPVTTPPDDVATEWEGSNDASYVTEDDPWVNEAKSDLEEDKSKRKTTEIRVENPDDPDQHVFVERIDKTAFKDKTTGKEFTFEFKWN